MPRLLSAVKLAVGEALLPPDLVRTPEPTPEMNGLQSVDTFHDAGANSLLPVYHFNALAVHALAPPGAHVVDLGSGSGRFLIYLARCRPDLRITGLELAGNMLQRGREAIALSGLDKRVHLVEGDMRAFREQQSTRIDLVTNIFALHHLNGGDDLGKCLREIGAVVSEGAGLWLFDHARPRRCHTARMFPAVFTPEAAPAFREDSFNSLRASWSFDELTLRLRATVSRKTHSECARLLPLYQIHWLECPRSERNGVGWVDAPELSKAVRLQARSLRRLFRSCPE